MASGRQLDVMHGCHVLRQAPPKINEVTVVETRYVQGQRKMRSDKEGDRQERTVLLSSRSTRARKLCLDYVPCTSAPTQGCDRGDRVNDTVSDNDKYSRAARERAGTQGECVMQEGIRV